MPLTIIDNVGNTLANGYDTMGRLSSASRTTSLLASKTVSYQYDLASNRTRLTWADGYYANYTYDGLNHLSTVIDSGGTTLATYGYDDLARRTQIQYNGSTGAKMLYAWSPENDLNTLSSDFAGTANDVSFTNIFTPAHQWSVATVSSGAYVYAAPSATSATFSINTVNEYPLLNGATALAYDTRGDFLGTAAAPNLAYDAENHLVGYTAASATYAFDPLGRRSSKTVAGTTTNFVHDGGSEIAEYDGSGALIRRFVPGAAIDEYVAMVTAAGTKTFFHTDKMGSVIAMSDMSGNLVEGPYLYDGYGQCRTGGAACTATGEPFRYTGQRLDAELNCLYYRARNYCPGQGRFYQTDPVGYGPDINWYNYVGNDPTDKSDPFGMSGCADMAAQHLTGQCINSTNFRPNDVRDSNGNIAEKSNEFHKDAVGTSVTDRASADHAASNQVSSGNEGVNRINVKTNPDGSASTSITAVPVINASPIGAQVKDLKDLSGAAAAEHPHIPGDPCCGRSPGKGDWQIPATSGKANYVEQKGGSIVVEISGGQIRIRVVSGPDLSKQTGDYRTSQAMVNSYQEHGGSQ